MNFLFLDIGWSVFPTIPNLKSHSHFMSRGSQAFDSFIIQLFDLISSPILVLPF